MFASTPQWMDTRTFRADAAIFSSGPRSKCGQKPPEDLETNFVDIANYNVAIPHLFSEPPSEWKPSQVPSIPN
ncbi:hypothetical protein PpBr36_08288 [Pyricularia pennisetigena]|uniref:hypothetical protein n=1 Tax=Pyricularia pennisetigena TaxID=1578925 RepID=UPI00114ED3C9|nr:hypothetical protein PpBr36_08288 [Pyricularia pennisetigena]TLS24021.1 hypothetical protein PpBr36_08288 [Pyricularia pennisetigena]